MRVALASTAACASLFGCASPKREAYVWQDPHAPEPPPDPAIVVLDGSPVGDKFEVTMFALARLVAGGRHEIRTLRGSEAMVDWLVASGALYLVDQAL